MILELNTMPILIEFNLKSEHTASIWFERVFDETGSTLENFDVFWLVIAVIAVSP